MNTFSESNINYDQKFWKTVDQDLPDLAHSVDRR